MIETLRGKDIIFAPGKPADSTNYDETEFVRFFVCLFVFKIAYRIFRKAEEQAQL